MVLGLVWIEAAPAARADYNGRVFPEWNQDRETRTQCRSHDFFNRRLCLCRQAPEIDPTGVQSADCKK